MDRETAKLGKRKVAKLGWRMMTFRIGIDGVILPTACPTRLYGSMRNVRSKQGMINVYDMSCASSISNIGMDRQKLGQTTLPFFIARIKNSMTVSVTTQFPADLSCPVIPSSRSENPPFVPG